MISRPRVVTGSRQGTRTSLPSYVNRESSGGPQRGDPPRPSTLCGAATPRRPAKLLGNNVGDSNLLCLGCSLAHPTVAGNGLSDSISGTKHAHSTNVGPVGVVLPVGPGFTNRDPFGLAPLIHANPVLDLSFRRLRGPRHVGTALVLLINLQTFILLGSLMRVTGTFVRRRISGPALGTIPLLGVSHQPRRSNDSLVLPLRISCYRCCLLYY